MHHSPRLDKSCLLTRTPAVNGREKVICVRNLEHNQILQKSELLRNSSGLKLRRVTKPVVSVNDSVRGVFSPFHGDAAYKV